MEQFFLLIERVPAAIWSAVIASLLAFGGVLLSNWITLSTLNRRLAHEASESAKQRKSAIRKEVYLSAAEELVRASVYLSSIAQQSAVKIGSEFGLTGFAVAIAKLQILLQSDIALMAGQISAQYAMIQILVLPKLFPIHALQADIEFKNGWYERTQSEIPRILNLQVQHNESGGSDREYFARLQQSFISQQALAAQIQSDRQKAWGQLLPMQREVTKIVMAEVRKIQPLALKLLIAMRADFEVDSDTEAFSRQAEKNLNEVTSQMNTAFADLDVQMRK